jgi:hypothetical protein
MSSYTGNLFKISILRIPQDQDFADPLSAVNGYVSGAPFCVGMTHTSKDDLSYYVAVSSGKVIAEGDSLEDVGCTVLETAKAKLQLTDPEVEELQNILFIQDDAEYDLDEDKWRFSLGNGGEVSLNEEFIGGIIVNVTPYYETEVTVAGNWGEADDDACCEEHEFCGALRAEESES